jgi:hypothetical protein
MRALLHIAIDHIGKCDCRVPQTPVAPKAEALKCNDCHGKDGRMDWKALGYVGDPRSGKK